MLQDALDRRVPFSVALFDRTCAWCSAELDAELFPSSALRILPGLEVPPTPTSGGKLLENQLH